MAALSALRSQSFLPLLHQQQKRISAQVGLQWKDVSKSITVGKTYVQMKNYIYNE